MNEKTKEEGMSLVRNGTVRTKEEYEEAKRRIEYYIKEYKWLTEGVSAEERVKEVEEEARKIRPMIKIDASEDERAQQEYYRRYYQILVRKQRLIKSGRYAPFLKQNIIVLYAAIKQFEIDSLEYTASSLIKGTLNGDKDVIENWKTDRLLSRMRILEGLPKEEDLILQPAQELLQTVTKDLVNIKAPETEEEQSLLPAISEGYLSPNQAKLLERVEAYMKDAGVGIEKATSEKHEAQENYETQERNGQHRIQDSIKQENYNKFRIAEKDKQKENKPKQGRENNTKQGIGEINE